MRIRRLTPEDALPYRQLMFDAYAKHPDAFTSSATERAALPVAWWEARLSAAPEPSDVVLGAIRDDTIVGVAGLSFESREKASHKAKLFGMYVPPQHRNGGIGRRLVLAALEYARKRERVRVVQLTVTHGNAAAQSLYEGCGFVQFGIEPFAVAVGDSFVSKLHMWCDLEPTPIAEQTSSGAPMPRVTSPKQIAAALSKLWSPRVVAEVDDSYVKVAKVRGTFGWHAHEDEDELFLILKGRLCIEMEDGAVDLAEGDVFVVPKGVRHNPVAKDECHVMLIERKSTLHTGDVVNERTCSIEEQLRPV